MAEADTTTYQANIPSFAKSAMERLISDAENLTSVEGNLYKEYPGERIAQFTPLQKQSFQAAETMAPAWQYGAASNLANLASYGGLGASYRGYQPGRFAPETMPEYRAYQPGRFAPSTMPEYKGYQPGQFTSDVAKGYMNPYLQNVVDIEKREAARQSAILSQQDKSQATARGAYGGARSAIVEAERQRNLAQQQGDIQARGLQAAYEQAANRYQQEQQLGEQARQYGAGLGMQGRQLGLQEQQLGEQSKQYGAGLGLQNRQLGLQEQQLGEQARQYGAGIGLQGLQTALQGAGTLGTLGGQQFQQGLDINKLQQQYGTQQQKQIQDALTQKYQDFLAQEQYPYQQLDFMSNILRGAPMSSGTMQSVYSAPPSTSQTLLSGLTGAAGLYSLLGAGKAEGGEVHYYEEGGVVGANSGGSFGDDPYDAENYGLGGIALNRLAMGGDYAY